MKTEKTIKLILAGNETLPRMGIRKLLSEFGSINVIWETGSGKELFEKYSKLKPDVVVTSILLEHINGFEAAVKILKKNSSAKILFLSSLEDDEYIYQALKAGALGFVNQKILPINFVEAVKKVNKREKYFLGFFNEKLNEIFTEYDAWYTAHILNKKITFKEDQVLKLIGDGLSNEKIAIKLFLSKRTIDKYRSNLMKKFDFTNKSELTRFAYKYNKIHLPK